MNNYITKLKEKSSKLIYDPIVGNFIGWFIASFFIASTVYINDENGKITNNNLIIIGIMIGTLITTRLHALREAIRFEIDKKEPTSHFWRGFFVVVISYFIGLIIHFVGDGISFQSCLNAIYAAFLIGSEYYLCFDSILNTDRGKSATYITKSKKGSISDKIFSKLPDSIEKYFFIIIKVLLFIIALYLYINKLNTLE
jgi:hypothetical protein